MQFSAYYQRELDWLLQEGQRFSRVHNEAQHLAQRSGDPDAERLLEGFAFLSAKIHARLDSAAPDLLHPLAEVLMPHILRPTPSCAMLEVRMDASQGRSVVELPKHALVCSRPMDGMPLTMRTTRPLRVLPIELESIKLSPQGSGRSRLALVLRGPSCINQLLGDQGYLDLYFDGPAPRACALTMALLRDCSSLCIEDPDASSDEQPLVVHPEIESLGLDDEHPLLDWPDPRAWRGHLQLAEYFALPEKFRHLRVRGLDALASREAAQTLRLSFSLDRCASSFASIPDDAIRLHCVPAINLFAADAEPIRIDPQGAAYRIRPCGMRTDQVEVYDLARVTSVASEQNTRTELDSFVEGATKARGPRYLLERRPSAQDGFADAFIRLVSGPHAQHPKTLSLELLCTQRGHCAQLKSGELDRCARPLPGHVRIRNLGAPTHACPAPLHQELLWRLISLASLRERGPFDLSSLHRLMHLYNAPARVKTARGQHNTRLIEALCGLSSQVITGLVGSAPVRGRRDELVFQEQDFEPDELLQVSQILAALLHDTRPLNSIQESVLRLTPTQRRFRWPSRI